MARPLLESGDVVRWFASNNWNYPVQGQLAKGMAGVQQFFEAMGRASPPVLQVSQSEVRFRCQGPDPVRFQVLLSTTARKWVYGWVTSDQPWLKVLTPHVNGPQRATISFEVDGRALPRVQLVQATLSIVANAGQKLPIRVVVENRQGDKETGRQGDRKSQAESSSVSSTGRRHSLLAGVLTMALVFLLVRMGLVPLADFWLRGADVNTAAAKLNVPISSNSPVAKTGGWLQLPWTDVLSGTGSVPTALFDDPDVPVNREPLKMDDFRHYFVKYFTRDLVFWLWWLGPVVAVIMVRRRGGRFIDFPFALLAGSAGGIICCASLACGYLMLDSVPHIFWDMLFPAKGNWILLMMWVLLALILWTGVGGVVGLVCGLDNRLRRAIIVPAQKILAGVLRMCGLSSLALRVGG